MTKPQRDIQAALQVKDGKALASVHIHRVIQLQQIQFLSHQSKISSKIQIFTFVPPVGGPSSYSLSDLKFKRLGYLSLDSNQRSDYQARQLKSVYISSPSYCLRLVLHQCHTNRFNLHNQVGLIALTCHGNMYPSMPGSVPQAQYQQKGLPRPPSSGPIDKIDQYEEGIREKIKILMKQKEKAVNNQDFDMAKMYKAGIDNLLAVAPHVTHLSSRKLKAIQMQDYDSAKVIKTEIQRIKGIVFSQLPGQNAGYFPPQSAGGQDD